MARDPTGLDYLVQAEMNRRTQRLREELLMANKREQKADRFIVRWARVAAKSPHTYWILAVIAAGFVVAVLV